MMSSWVGMAQVLPYQTGQMSRQKTIESFIHFDLTPPDLQRLLLHFSFLWRWHQHVAFLPLHFHHDDYGHVEVHHQLQVVRVLRLTFLVGLNRFQRPLVSHFQLQ